MKDEKLGDTPDAVDEDGATTAGLADLCEALLDSLSMSQLMIIAEALTPEQKAVGARLYVEHAQRNQARDTERDRSPRPAFSMN